MLNVFWMVIKDLFSIPCDFLTYECTVATAIFFFPSLFGAPTQSTALPHSTSNLNGQFKYVFSSFCPHNVLNEDVGRILEVLVSYFNIYNVMQAFSVISLKLRTFTKYIKIAFTQQQWHRLLRYQFFNMKATLWSFSP